MSVDCVYTGKQVQRVNLKSSKKFDISLVLSTSYQAVTQNRDCLLCFVETMFNQGNG